MTRTPRTGTKVSTKTPVDTRITWAPGCKPTMHPHTTGTLFFAVGRTAQVIWDDTTTPTAVAVVALVVA